MTRRVWMIMLIAVAVLGGVVGWRLIMKPKKVVPRINPEAVYVPDEKGEVVEAVRVLGVVEEWNPDSGVLLVELNNGKKQYFELKPPKTAVYTPEARKKTGRIYLVNSREHLHWNTAFCKGDTVTVAVKGNEVAGIDNSGYRMCGLRE